MTIMLINGCVFFPHRFAWRSKPKCPRTRQTDIQMGLKGAESRSAPRPVARRTVSVEIFSRDSERAHLEARIDAAKKSGFGCIPLIGRGSYLAANAVAGTNMVNVTTDAWHWQNGDYVALVADDQTFDVLPVIGVAAGVLTLNGNLNFNWASGYCIRPVIFGAFTTPDKQSIITGRAAAWRITITELTSDDSVQIGVTPAAKPGIGHQVIGKTNQL